MVEEHAAPDEIPNQKKLNLTFIQYHFISIISHQSEKCSAQPLGLVSVIFQAFQENFRKLFSIILKVSKKMKGKNGVKTFCEILEFVWMDRKGHRAGRWLSSESSDDPSGGSRRWLCVPYPSQISPPFPPIPWRRPCVKQRRKNITTIKNFKLEIVNYFSYFVLLSFGYGINGDELASWTSPSVSAFTFSWFFRRGFDLLNDVSFHLRSAVG